MSKKIVEHKQSLVNDLVQELQACQSFLIYEYAGFTAKEATELRAQLRSTGCSMTVHKNNILNRALQSSGLHNGANLIGPNALVLGTEDIEPLKNIAKMADKKTFIKLKAAYVDGHLMLGDELTNFATLPTKKDLYVMICQCLQSPLRKFMQVVKQVGKAK